MAIDQPCVVRLSWSLTDCGNRLIDAVSDPVGFFYGDADLLPRLEEALAGRAPGDEVRVQLEPEPAFGDYQPGLVCFEARDLFPQTLEPGMTFEGRPEGAVTPDMPADALCTLTEVYPSHLVLDGNHPLAGMALRITIQVHDLRAATAAEIDRGSLGSAGLLVVDATAPGGVRR